MMRKFHEAKQSGSPNVTVWGTGTPLREFMHVDDLADAGATIGYEILTHLGARYSRRYVEGGA